MLSSPLTLGFSPNAPVVRSAGAVRMNLGDISFESKPWTTDEISDKAGMAALATKLNPSIGFWDPLAIVEGGSPETIGWFRHAEIKHGRVAMAAFVGYCVQANGIHFPWNLQGPLPILYPDMPVVSFADIAAAGGPADQWDALPSAAKCQFFFAIGFLEWYGVRAAVAYTLLTQKRSDTSPPSVCDDTRAFVLCRWSETPAALAEAGTVHYVRGGKPGVYPPLSNAGIPHPVPLNLWDPFGFTKKMTPEKKEKALLAEINNGRLAMIGIFGLISASKGLQVPIMDGLNIPKYAGEVMAPFSEVNKDLAFVPEMLAQKILADGSL